MPRLMRRLGDQEFAVIGLGRFGRALAVRLEETGHAVLGIDHNPSLVQEVASLLTDTVVLDATNADALRAAGIPSFRTVIVAIGRDFEATMLCVGALKELDVPNIIAQARSDRHGHLLSLVGANRVVKPLQTGGERLAEELGIPALLKRLDISPGYTIAEIELPRKLQNKKLADLTLREKDAITILLIRRGDDVIVSPPANTVLQKGDSLIVLGPNDRVLALADS